MSTRTSLPFALTAALFGVLPTCARADAPDRAPSRPPTSEVGPPSVTVLFVLTGSDTQTLARGKTRRTGYFLGEFYGAYRAVRAAGFDVAIATPDARPAPVDPEGLAAKYWTSHPAWLGEAQALVAEDPGLNALMRIDAALAAESEFAALVVPGGQGLMNDLVDDPDVHALLARFAADDRPIGLLCHAPAILTHLPRDADPLRGRRVTSVSGFDEFYIVADLRNYGFELRMDGRDPAAGTTTLTLTATRPLVRAAVPTMRLVFDDATGRIRIYHGRVPPRRPTGAALDADVTYVHSDPDTRRAGTGVCYRRHGGSGPLRVRRSRPPGAGAGGVGSTRRVGARASRRRLAVGDPARLAARG